MVSKKHVPTRAVQPASDARTSGGYITPRAAGVSRPSGLGRAWMALLLGLSLLLSPLAGLSRPLLAATTATITASVLNIRGGPGTSYAKVGTLLQGARVTVLEQGGEWLKIQYNGSSTGWVSRSLVSLDAPAAAAASSSSGVKTAAASGGAGTAVVTAASANLRAGAGTGFAVTGSVKKGDVLSVYSSSSGWYLVKTATGASGYIAGWLVNYSPGGAVAAPSAGGSTSAAPSTAASASSSSGAIGTATVKGTVLNLRSGPGTTWAVAGKATQGQKLTVLARQGDWLKVKTASGLTAWAAAWLVTFIPAASNTAAGITSSTAGAAASSTPASCAIGTATVKGAVLNLRSGPGTSWAVAGRATQGQKLAVLARQGDWLKVKTASGLTAWAAAWLVSYSPATAPATTSTSAPAPAPAAPVTPSRAPIGQAVVKSSQLNLRSGPGTTYPTVGQVAAGTSLAVLAVKGDWLEVRSASGGSAWVAGWLVSYVPASIPGPAASPSTGAPAAETEPSRGESPRAEEPQPDPEPAQLPTPVPVEGQLLDISEIVAGNVQVITVKLSGATEYQGSERPDGYTLLLKGIRSSGFEGHLSLNGLGATRIEVSQQEPEASGEGATGYAALPSTTLALDAQGRCVYGLVPADGGKQLKLFIKTDIGARTSGRVRVVLDAGHGGKDTGAIGPSGVYEKDINLPITLEVGRILEGEGVEVTYTRSDDTYLTLSERSQVANAIAADVFVSVHCNGSTDRSKEGTSVYYYAPADNALLAAQEFDRCKLAGFIQEALLQALGRTDKGVRTANFAVLRETIMPSALVETLFLSHPLEEQLLAMPETQSTAAQAIARGILDYLRWAGRS